MRQHRTALRVIVALFIGLLSIGVFSDADGRSLPDGVIARVGSKEIPVRVFLDYLSFRKLDPAAMSAIQKEEMMNAFLVDWQLANDATERGYAADPEYTLAVERYTYDILGEIYFKKVFLDNTSLVEEDYLPYFAGLTDLADISVILLEDTERANEIRGIIASGVAFEEAAKRYSKGLSAYKGGRNPEVSPGDPNFSAEERKAIFSSSPGDILGPFANPTGMTSLIRVRSVKKLEARKEEIRAGRADEIRREKAERQYLIRLNELMVKSEIEINEAYFGEAKTDGKADGKTDELKTPYLAWVKGHYIYPRDLAVDPSSGQHSAQQLRSMLNRQIMKIVAAEEAKALGFTDSEEYIEKERSFRISVLPNLYLFRRFVASAAPVSDWDIESFYKEYYTPDVYKVWVCLNPDRKVVEKALRAVKEKKESLDQIARQYSVDESRSRGGVVGPLSPGTFDPVFRSPIRKMKEGEVTRVLKIGDKFGIAVLLDHQKVEVPDLQELSPKIRQRIITQRRATFVENERKQARRRMRVTINKERLAELQ